MLVAVVWHVLASGSRSVSEAAAKMIYIYIYIYIHRYNICIYIYNIHIHMYIYICILSFQAANSCFFRAGGTLMSLELAQGRGGCELGGFCFLKASGWKGQ